MKMGMLMGLGIAAALIVATAGCDRRPGSDPSAPAGSMERTGAAMDTAAENTKESTGAALEKAGSAMEKAGSDMQE